MMKRHTDPLSYVKVAAPCRADWEQMIGNERMRFCSQCQLNVYNLSGMTRAEAESLISNSEGRLCVRYYRRADGTILTRNCPVGLSAIKRRVSRLASAALSAVLSFFAGVGFYNALDTGSSAPSWHAPASGEKKQYPAVMGTMAAPRLDESREGRREGEMKLAPTMGGVAINDGPSQRPRLTGKTKR